MKLFHTEKVPGRLVQTTNGQNYLYFSGTDYLGLAHDETFRTYILQGLENYGLHYGSSRNNSLRLVVYEETEKSIARYSGAPGALLTSSGMCAGQLVLRGMQDAFGQVQSVFHTAPGAHPSIQIERATSASSWEAWATGIVAHIEEHQRSMHIICTDAVGSPWVEKFDFPILSSLRDRENVWFIVDESHTLGVWGDQGGGLYAELFSVLGERLIVVSSLNKALGIPAGIILAPEDVLKALRQNPWYAGASPPSPAYVWALDELLQSDELPVIHGVLRQNVIYFQEKIGVDWFQYIPGYPVHCSNDMRLYDHLLDHGIMASCFSYPGPSDPPVTRIAISASHKKEDLDKLIEVCQLFFS